MASTSGPHQDRIYPLAAAKGLVTRRHIAPCPRCNQGRIKIHDDFDALPPDLAAAFEP